MTPVLMSIAVLMALVLGLTWAVITARRIMLPERAVTVTVNSTNAVATLTGRKLLGALNDNGILVPSSCAGAGTCGLCRVRVTGDHLPALPVEQSRLSQAEIRDGMHLACQVTIRDHMNVEVSDDLLAAETFQARVASITALTPLIREVVVDLPDGQADALFAGAFFQITAPSYALEFDRIEVPEKFLDTWAPLRTLSVRSDAPATRAYSIANRPEDTQANRVVFNIRLALPPPGVANVPPGLVSSWLFSLRAGDQIPIAGPFGSFRVQDTDRELVFLGGGVGMAPLRAMIFQSLQVTGNQRKITFWYGARSMNDLLYVDEFNELAARHENFDWTVALSDPAPDSSWTGATGFIHAVVWQNYLRDHPNPQNCDFYLCGPPMMVAAILDMLDRLGVEPEQIFRDDFGV